MSSAKFKTMRHIETVRNYLDNMASVLRNRGQVHDQSKLKSPEAEILEEFTPKLRGLTYGSQEYRDCLAAMRPMVEHHNRHNRHHPEHHEHGVLGMNLIDLLEMLCDWKAAGLRHEDGDIYRSLEINTERFNIPGPISIILHNTVRDIIEPAGVYHHADES